MHVQTADGVQVIDTSPPCSGCESPPHCQLQIGCTVTPTHDLHTHAAKGYDIYESVVREASSVMAGRKRFADIHSIVVQRAAVIR